MKIMICGGYEEAESTDQPIVEFVRLLAAQIILQGHELRSGNISSLDAVAIESACKAAEAKGCDPEAKVVSYIPLGADARVIMGNVKESSGRDWSSVHGRRPSVPEPIADTARRPAPIRRRSGLASRARRSFRWRPSAWPRGKFSRM